MFAVGTSVLYGRTGVCRVEGVGVPPSVPGAGGRLYYTLRALYSSSGETIYLPVDSASALRPLIGSGEAAACLAELPHLEAEVFSGRRPADVAAHYQSLLASNAIRDCLRLIKEVCRKQEELASQRRGLSQVDIRYLKMAERLVTEELAAALGRTPQDMRECLYRKES